MGDGVYEEVLGMLSGYYYMIEYNYMRPATPTGAVRSISSIRSSPGWESRLLVPNSKITHISARY